jgi:hypothetical protein
VEETKMTKRLVRAVLLVSTMAAALSSFQSAVAGDEKALVGSYVLAKRVAQDGRELHGPDVVGLMTFTKTYRTVIMKWIVPDAGPASIAFITTYSLSRGKYCESVVYGANANLGAPGVTYDVPSAAPACTAASSDASGLSFDVPGEHLRLRVTRDGFIATAPRWTDHWERVK